jgi:hypothetical protein
VDKVAAVINRLEHAGQTAGGRGVIAQKHVVAWQGEPQEFGRRVQAPSPQFETFQACRALLNARKNR